MRGRRLEVVFPKDTDDDLVNDSVVENGYEEALLPYFHDCRIRTDLDLMEAIRGMLTEIAEEGNLSERVLKHNTGFILGILSLEP